MSMLLRLSTVIRKITKREGTPLSEESAGGLPVDFSDENYRYFGALRMGFVAFQPVKDSQSHVRFSGNCFRRKNLDIDYIALVFMDGCVIATSKVTLEAKVPMERWSYVKIPLGEVVHWDISFDIYTLLASSFPAACNDEFAVRTLVIPPLSSLMNGAVFFDAVVIATSENQVDKVDKTTDDEEKKCSQQFQEQQPTTTTSTVAPSRTIGNRAMKAAMDLKANAEQFKPESTSRADRSVQQKLKRARQEEERQLKEAEAVKKGMERKKKENETKAIKAAQRAARAKATEELRKSTELESLRAQLYSLQKTLKLEGGSDATTTLGNVIVQKSERNDMPTAGGVIARTTIEEPAVFGVSSNDIKRRLLLKKRQQLELTEALAQAAITAQRQADFNLAQQNALITAQVKLRHVEEEEILLGY
jgi:hypothetical protein